MIRNFIKDKIDKLDTKAIYIISIFVSLIFIVVSYIPYGIKGAEVILQGVGCSGITAGIMAIYIFVYVIIHSFCRLGEQIIRLRCRFCCKHINS